MLAQLLLFSRHAVARGVAGHDEGADALLARVRVGHREDQEEFAALAAADELLGAVDDELVALAHRAGFQVGRVRAGLRFGQREARVVIAARDGA